MGSKTTKNKKGNTENENKVSVFRFPDIYKDHERRRIWEASVPREGFKATSNSVLCEKHFVAGDFVTDRGLKSVQLRFQWVIDDPYCQHKQRGVTI